MMISVICPDGYDEDELVEELDTEEDPNENTVVGFFEDLDDFPYGDGCGYEDPETDEGRKQFILDLIVKLSKNPDLVFGSKIPKCIYSLCFTVYTLTDSICSDMAACGQLLNHSFSSF